MPLFYPMQLAGLASDAEREGKKGCCRVCLSVENATAQLIEDKGREGVGADIVRRDRGRKEKRGERAGHCNHGGGD